jgi:CBS domain-containing protein
MKIGVKVGDIMTRDFVSVRPNISIIDAARRMIKKRVGSLVLQEEGELKGLLTERDIIWAMTKKSVEELRKIRAEDLAKKKVTIIKPSADLYEALQKMRKSKYRWLPVVVKKKVIGFLTLKDILKIEPSLFEMAREGWQIKEEQEKLRRRASRVGGREYWLREGVCEECGNFELLYKQDGRLICEDCRDSM